MVSHGHHFRSRLETNSFAIVCCLAHQAPTLQAKFRDCKNVSSGIRLFFPIRLVTVKFTSLDSKSKFRTATLRFPFPNSAKAPHPNEPMSGHASKYVAGGTFFM